MTHEILIVEPDESCARRVKNAVASAENSVEHTSTYEGAMEILEGRRMDLVLTEMALGERRGVDLCRWLRRDGCRWSPPVVFLSSRDRETDRIEGLEAGATDYVTKPFSDVELRHRLTAILRRTRIFSLRNSLVEDSDDKEGGFEVDVKGERISLTRNEYRLFQALVKSNGRVLNRRQLVQAIWGGTSEVQERSVDAHVKGLRKRLKRNQSVIETVHGVGYRLARGWDEGPR